MRKPTPNGYAHAYQRRSNETLRLIREVAPPPATVLDVAAAQGNFSLRLAELGYDVTWNDLREDLADYVRLKYESGTLRFAAGNAFEIGAEGRFDVVLITEIIEHVAHPDEFLRKVGALVKPGGFVVMTTPNGDYTLNSLPRFSDCADPSVFEAVQFKPNADGHIFLLHPDEIPALAAKAGLRIKHLQIMTNLVTNGHFKTALLLRLLPKALIDTFEEVTSALPPIVKNKFHVCMGAVFQRPYEQA